MVTPTSAMLKLVAASTKARDLTLRQLALLELAAFDGTEVRLASTGLAMSRPACTRAADRLTDEGLLKRQPILGDRRRALLVATKKGKSLIEEIARLYR